MITNWLTFTIKKTNQKFSPFYGPEALQNELKAMGWASTAKYNTLGLDIMYIGSVSVIIWIKDFVFQDYGLFSWIEVPKLWAFIKIVKIWVHFQ